MTNTANQPKLRYTKAPLPFQGQKRMFLKPFAAEIKKFSPNSIFIDVFGGSGLLSRTIKDIHPSSRVIYNDFDHYSERLRMIPTTEQIRCQLAPIVASIPKSKRLDQEHTKSVADVLASFEASDKPIDYVTLSSWLLYTMHYFYSVEELYKLRLYNCVPLTPIAPATDYLDGLEVTHTDYRKLLDDFSDYRNAVFILDPPYLSTDNSQYNLYWGIEQYLKVIEHLPNHNFIYFASGKSDFIQFMQWAENKLGARNPFAAAKKYTRRNTAAANTYYTDVMYVVH